MLKKKDDLKLGKQVILETAQHSKKVITQKIRVYYPIAGKITQKMGQEMMIDHRYKISIADAKMDEKMTLDVGTFVAINGFELSKNVWKATRINHNQEHKRLYQAVPPTNFSSRVKQVLIETSPQQMMEWAALKGMKNNHLPQEERVILMGKYENKGIFIKEMSKFSDAIRSSNKGQSEKEGNINKKGESSHDRGFDGGMNEGSGNASGHGSESGFDSGSMEGSGGNGGSEGDMGGGDSDAGMGGSGGGDSGSGGMGGGSGSGGM